MIDYDAFYLANALNATQAIYQANDARYALANSASPNMTFGQISALHSADKAYTMGSLNAQLQYEYSMAALEATRKMQHDYFETRKRAIAEGNVFG